MDDYEVELDFWRNNPDEAMEIHQKLGETEELLQDALEREKAYEQYIERQAENHEEERARTILNANKVRKTAAKIARERNEALEMVNEARQLLAVVHRDGGHHTEEVGFAQSCKDAMKVYHDLRERVGSLLDARESDLREWCEQTDAARALLEAIEDNLEGSVYPSPIGAAAAHLNTALGE